MKNINHYSLLIFLSHSLLLCFLTNAPNCQSMAPITQCRLEIKNKFLVRLELIFRKPVSTPPPMSCFTSWAIWLLKMADQISAFKFNLHFLLFGTIFVIVFIYSNNVISIILNCLLLDEALQTIINSWLGFLNFFFFYFSLWLLVNTKEYDIKNISTNYVLQPFVKCAFRPYWPIFSKNRTLIWIIHG